MWTPSARFANEVRLAYGRNFQYEQAQKPLAAGAGNRHREATLPRSQSRRTDFTFGTPAGVGRTAYPDERRLQLADTATWQFGRHLLQAGADFSAVHDEVGALNNTAGTFLYDSGTTNGRAGGLVDWITDYTFNVNAYPNGACPSINATVHNFCFQSFTQSFGQQAVAFNTQDWSAFVQDNWQPPRKSRHQRRPALRVRAAPAAATSKRRAGRGLPRSRRYQHLP